MRKDIFDEVIKHTNSVTYTTDSGNHAGHKT